MNLDDAQRRQVAQWIEQGLKLSDIQSRLTADLGLKLTYMEVRLLVDDLKLVPKDPEPVKPIVPAVAPDSLAAPAIMPTPPVNSPPLPTAAATGAGQVAISLDQLTRAGAMISGKVTFSDGQMADWYLDQTGRLGLAAKQPGYRPSAADVQEFQMALEQTLAKAGL